MIYAANHVIHKTIAGTKFHGILGILKAICSPQRKFLLDISWQMCWSKDFPHRFQNYPDKLRMKL